MARSCFGRPQLKNVVRAHIDITKSKLDKNVNGEVLVVQYRYSTSVHKLPE